LTEYLELILNYHTSLLSLFFKMLDKTEEWALWWWCRGCSRWWSWSRSSCPARACLACSHAGFAA